MNECKLGCFTLYMNFLLTAVKHTTLSKTSKYACVLIKSYWDGKWYNHDHSTSNLRKNIKRNVLKYFYKVKFKEINFGIYIIEHEYLSYI